MIKTMNLLKKLNLKRINPGASSGPSWWSTTTNAGQILSYNPANGKVIATVNQCSKDDFQHIVQKAQEAFLTWRETPAPQRGEFVRQIGERLREYKSTLGTLVAMETGKSKQEGDGEVQEMIDMADLAVGQSRMLYGNTMHSERAHHRMYEQWHPLGIVGVISAFNFPVAVWAWNAFNAAVCGDTVIWKPSSKTPLSAIAIQQICNEVMQQNHLTGIFSLMISEDKDLATAFTANRQIPLISFTGSTAVGHKVSQVVSQRLGRCLLECSGNNAVIIDETADLKLAIPSVIFGALGTAGQRCTSTRRLFIHESLYETVTSHLINTYQKITIGDPLDQKNLMGPLIDEKAVIQFNETIEAIKKSGGEILYGGHALDRPGFFVEPTIATAKNDWDIVQSETFAPILYVMQYSDFHEAVQMQNSVCQGLSSALFTNHLKHAEQFLAASGSDCGIANINIGTSGAEIGGAFGGEKATGGGREAGSDVWKTYMRRQTNTINWSDKLPLAQGIEFDIR